MRSIRAALLSLAIAVISATFFAPSASANPNIINVKLDNANPKVGQTINWLVEVDCAGLPVQQVYMQLADPSGVVGWLNNNNSDLKNAATGSVATIRVPLKITDEAASGLYSVKSISLTCQNKNGGEYRWTGSLDSISFRVQNDKATAPSQPKIEKLEVISGKEVKPGEQIRIAITATGQGKLNSINLTLRAPNGFEIQKFFNQYGQSPSGEESKKISNLFVFDVDEDWVGGVYRISRIDIQGYAGIDLSNPDPANPNPANSTSSFSRSLSLTFSSSGFQQVFGSPETQAQPQPSLANISIIVNNPNPTELVPPEFISIKVPSVSVSAGETFEILVSVDAKNAYLYSLGMTFHQKDKTGNAFGCSTDQIQKSAPRKNWIDIKLLCQTQRINPPGTYLISSAIANSTSCNIAAPNLYNQENQSCVTPPKSRYTNLNFQNGYGSVSQSPVTKSSAINLLDGTQVVTLSAAKALQAPKYKSVEVGSSEIKVFYPWTYEISCDFSASSGNIKSGTNDKIYDVVTISGLKPATDVVLSGTCTAQDKTKVSFVETFTTAIPPAPYLPSVIAKKQEIDSVIVYLSDLNQEGVDYSVQATKGNVVIAGNNLFISDLKPGQSSVITMKMKDNFGQETSGIIGTFVTLQPPKLTTPVVTLVLKNRSGYQFKFLPDPELSYSVRGINCVTKIRASNITLSGFKVGKTASAYLLVTDKYGQKVETKFFTGKVAPSKG